MKRYVIGLDPFNTEAQDKLVIAEVGITEDTSGAHLVEEDTKEFRTAVNILRGVTPAGAVETFNLHKSRIEAIYWYYSIQAKEETRLHRALGAVIPRLCLAQDEIKAELGEWPTCDACLHDCYLETDSDGNHVWTCSYCCGDSYCPICS